MGSGFYGRSKGTIKSPYGTKNVEADPIKVIVGFLWLFTLTKNFSCQHKIFFGVNFSPSQS